jgi:hypothetical protein
MRAYVTESKEFLAALHHHDLSALNEHDPGDPFLKFVDTTNINGIHRSHRIAGLTAHDTALNAFGDSQPYVSQAFP